MVSRGEIQRRIDTQPYNQGRVSVDNDHQLYFEQIGNPEGLPIIYLHGGPGSGFTDRDRRFFDLKKCNVTFFDQRGAGRSTPFASIEHNTTQDLIGDVDMFRQMMGVEKVFLFGGSWGSTLALAYAMEHPDRVSGMMLRGIFFGDQADTDFYVGGGIAKHFPDVWDRFISLVPQEERHRIPQYYLEQMQSTNAETKERYTYEWARYEASIFKLDFAEEDLPARLDGLSYQSLSPLEAHYIANNCFLPEGHLRRGTQQLADIPTTIVHGRYDFVCAPENAFQLHDNLPDSQLFIETAGHSSSEPAIEKRLIHEMQKVALRRQQRTT